MTIIKPTLLILTLCALFATVAHAAEEDPALLLFETGYISGTKHKGYERTARDFSPWGGTALSTNAVLEAVPGGTGAYKWLPAGGTDQAVAFPATNSCPGMRGALGFWVTGQNWDINAAARETLVVIEGDDATVAVERSRPGQLSVVSSKTGRLDVPFAGDVNRPRFIFVNWDAAQTTLFLDAVEAGSVKGLVWPGAPRRLVFGQLGAGPGTNKYLERLATFRRPLTKGEITQEFLRFCPSLAHTVTVPRLTTPVTVDGILDDAAWKNAAVLAGMTAAQQGDYWFYGDQKTSEVEDRIHLAYDDKYLYVGYHNPAPVSIRDNPPLVAAMLKATRTGFDTDVDADDAFTIILRDPWPVGDWYSMTVNYANTHYEYTIGGKKLTGINLRWNPAWITKSTLDMDGWHLECAIPLDGFDQVPAPQPGDVWHMTFMRWWRTTLEGQTWWAAGLRLMDRGDVTFPFGGLGAVRFGGPQDAVVRLLQVGNINAGQLDVQAELFNPAASPQTLTVEISSNTGEVNARQEIALAAGERQPYTFQQRLRDFSTATAKFEVRDASGKAIYFHELPVPRSDKLDIYAFNYPTWGLVRYDVGCLSLAQHKAEDLSLKVTARDAKGKQVFTASFKGMPDYRRMVDVPMKEWTPGEYKVEFAFAHKGKAVARAEVVYAKKPMPEWLGNQIGYDGEFPRRPWTPMQADANAVSMWGRTYHFNDALLPVAIGTQGRPLLRAPMALTGATAEHGAFNTAGLAGGKRLTLTNNCRVEAERWVNVPGLTITNAYWVEYDGFCWLKFTLHPAAKTTLNSLTLTIPFTKEFSDVMNCSDYSIAKNDVIPPDGTTHSPALPIWVGNVVGGLQFFVDTTGPWSVKDEATSIRLENGPAGATLRVNMVDVPLTLTNAHSIEVAFTVTPVKDTFYRKIEPLPATTWNYAWFPNSEWMPGHIGFETPGNGNFFSCIRPESNPPQWVHGGPYSNMNMVHYQTGDAEGNAQVLEYGDEWSANQSARFRNGGFLNTSFHSPSFQDWIVWRYHQVFLNNPFRCMYHDVSHLVPSSNPFAHAGFVRADGSRAPSKGLLGIRQVYKRLFNFMAHYYPEGANSVFHSSGMPNMAYEGFGYRFWTDENLNSSINEKQPTYRGLITPAKFRAEYVGRNFGNLSSFIGQGRLKAATCYQYGVDTMWDHVKGLCLLHDLEKGAEAAQVDYRYGHRSGWNVYRALEARDTQALVRHNIYSLAYDFVGYWDQKVVTVPNANTYVSYYFRKDKERKVYDWESATGPAVVFIVWNESNWNGELSLAVDWQALGFDPGKPFRSENLVHRVGIRLNDPDPMTDKFEMYKKPEETAKVEAGKLVFPLSEYNYRMIAVWQPE